MDVRRRQVLAGIGGAAMAPFTQVTAAHATGGDSTDGGGNRAGVARAALKRLIPTHADQVAFRLMQGSRDDRFRIHGVEGHIVIAGTSPAVMLTGLNWYLKYVADANITWTDQQLNLPARLPAPDGPIHKKATVSHRFAFNDTNMGYTEPYAGWEYWEHAIDVLALHGINEVLVYEGQVDVYHQTLQHFGYTAKDLSRWIPNPAHQPWLLMQNMCCFTGPTSEQLLADRVKLGRRIADRLRALGMTPVFPGFYGTVPSDFVKKNPDAHVVSQGKWVGFSQPGWLDPTTTMFRDLASTFYSVQDKIFGATSMYKMDLLHEGGRAGDVDPGAASTAVQRALQQAHPGATWALLGWQDNPLPETIKAVDKSRMLVLDGLSDRYSDLNREKEWDHTPYAFGSIWNFGGHTTLGANMKVWNDRFWHWRNKTNSALSGIAIMPEGGDNNPVAFEFLTEMAWRDGPEDFHKWFDRWAKYRYGGQDEHAVRAWRQLADTAYSMPGDGWSEAQDGLYAAQPSLDRNTAAAWSPTSMRYDTAGFAEALPELLEVGASLRGSSAYRYDLMQVARQALANHSRVLLPRIKSAYKDKDIKHFRQLADRWLADIKLMDRVAGTDRRMMLGPWLRRATAQATSSVEAARLEYDARSLVSIWGDRQAADAGLRDYANREWSGLLGDYYHSRWKAYFDSLESAMASGKKPEQIDWYAFGKKWAHRRNDYPTKPSGDIVQIAQQVWHRLHGNG